MRQLFIRCIYGVNAGVEEINPGPEQLVWLGRNNPKFDDDDKFNISRELDIESLTMHTDGSIDVYIKEKLNAAPADETKAKDESEDIPF